MNGTHIFQTIEKALISLLLNQEDLRAYLISKE